jgi:two-component system, OmpR family, sensor histidine kinase MprB
MRALRRAFHGWLELVVLAVVPRALPLQRRVAYLTAVVVALAVAFTSIAGFVTVRFSLYASLDRDLITTARSLTGEVADDIQTLGGLNNRALRAGNLTLAAVRADGLRSYVPDEASHLVIGPEELRVARVGNGVSLRNGVNETGVRYRIVAVPIPEIDQVRYALVVGRPLSNVETILRSLLIVLSAFGLAGVIIAGLAGATVARSSLRPVRALSEAVERITATDELVPIAVTGNDELARLAESFNRMLSSLASSRRRQQQLIADASHELRTPLTSLRTNIELLALDASTGMLKPEDRKAILRDVSAQLAEFTDLIHDLVQLARDEKVAPSPEPIDFREVVRSALHRVRRRGPGLTFDVELDPLYVIGEADSLERAVTNLLDNAVKWSPPGGTVRVHLEGDRLRVADEGPGIAEEDLPYIFDRFYRADTARNTPGTGLGLSIVADTVERHGGWVKAGRSAQGGAEFTLRLPPIQPPRAEVGVRRGRQVERQSGKPASKS